ncbi:MAG: cold shock domain-containing protein [Chitinophagaceae bacterium]|nr:cold shock domain-containing protein [Chitinophagaceae bacterium]
MAESWNKKEREKKKQKEKRDKAEKMKERKEGGAKKSLDDMMAYVDENGNITSTPPDPKKRKEVNAEDIEISIPKQQDTVDEVRSGKVSFFNQDKGFGFIKDNVTQESIFVHVNNLSFSIKENDGLWQLMFHLSSDAKLCIT